MKTSFHAVLKKMPFVPQQPNMNTTIGQANWSKKMTHYIQRRMLNYRCHLAWKMIANKTLSHQINISTKKTFSCSPKDMAIALQQPKWNYTFNYLNPQYLWSIKRCPQTACDVIDSGCTVLIMEYMYWLPSSMSSETSYGKFKYFLKLFLKFV